jgi:hypothetical protein
MIKVVGCLGKLLTTLIGIVVCIWWWETHPEENITNTTTTTTTTTAKPTCKLHLLICGLKKIKIKYTVQILLKGCRH